MKKKEKEKKRAIWINCCDSPLDCNYEIVGCSKCYWKRAVKDQRSKRWISINHKNNIMIDLPQRTWYRESDPTHLKEMGPMKIDPGLTKIQSWTNHNSWKIKSNNLRKLLMQFKHIKGLYSQNVIMTIKYS